MINPAFGPAQVRRFTETFISKSIEVGLSSMVQSQQALNIYLKLRDVLNALSGQSTRKDGRVRIDAFSWLNKVTLDIIGLTGFGYDFDALHADDSQPNELYEAINKAMSAPRSFLGFIAPMLPILRKLVRLSPVTFQPTSCSPNIRIACAWVKKAAG